MKSRGTKFKRKMIFYIFAVTLKEMNLARMAELVDVLVSGTSVRKDVQVRVLFRAQEKQAKACFFFNYYQLIDFFQVYFSHKADDWEIYRFDNA